MSSAIKNLYEAKTELSALVDRAARGEEVVIAKNGVPMARLVPFGSTPRRTPGGWEGRVWVADDFDAPLTSEALADFEASAIEPVRPRKRAK